jgi:ATP-dependent DNA helicase RecG
MVVVRSPGGLPEPVTVENIRETNAARNVVVIRILRALGLAEDAGRGVDVMQDTMAAEMLDPPRFADHGHEVVVELPIRSAVAPGERAWIHELERRGTLGASDRIALVHAACGETLTNKRVRELTATDTHAARDVLHRLRDQGFLEQHGQRGGATYRLSGSLQAPPDCDSIPTSSRTSSPASPTPAQSQTATSAPRQAWTVPTPSPSSTGSSTTAASFGPASDAAHAMSAPYDGRP